MLGIAICLKPTLSLRSAALFGSPRSGPERQRDAIQVTTFQVPEGRAARQTITFH
jgi:hypothetical protein